MVILGVWDGTPASAALVVDGKLVCAVAEERLSRVKNAYGYPENAINAVLRAANLEVKDIDRVAMSTKSLLPMYFYTQRNAKFSVKDYWKEQNDYWFPRLYKGENPSYLDIFRDKIDTASFPYDEKLISNERDAEGMWKARLAHVCASLNVHENQVTFFDHHACHAYYGFLLSPNKDVETMVFTMDGHGDNTNGTVSISKSPSKLKVLSRSSNFNLGRMYRYATLLLGMKPADHEYKLMGLAAYNKEEFGRKAYEIYSDTFKVDGLEFKYNKEIKDNFFHFKQLLEGERFDAIAYGIQRFAEETLVSWIKNGIEQTGIRNIVMSGGVAQNIKANKLIFEQTGLSTLFIPPGPGDESLSVGAAFMEMLKHTPKHREPFQQPNAYFSLSFDEKN